MNSSIEAKASYSWFVSEFVLLYSFKTALYSSLFLFLPANSRLLAIYLYLRKGRKEKFFGKASVGFPWCCG